MVGRRWFVGALKEGTRRGGCPRMRSYANLAIFLLSLFVDFVTAVD